VRLLVVAVGQRQPGWVRDAVDDFVRRFPPECRLAVLEVKAEPRSGGKSAAQMKAAEAQRLRSALPRGSRVVALDERGTRRTTAELADRLREWRGAGQDVALLIGGPDGLDDTLKAEAQESLRLSDLTLPHALARVLLVEALYRAHTLLAGHPYHRE
jgi:23S rRNA (pseudouridine1915-N3)-methyltransferase